MDLEIDGLQEEEELFEHYRIEVDPGQTPVRMDVFLTSKIQNATRTKVQKAALAGSILCNGKAVKSNYKVKPGDVITVVLPEPPVEHELHPEPMELNIVYEDESLLVINKPAGMVVHPGYNNYSGTLVHGLLHHFKTLPYKENPLRPGLVHRIDKNTSGLLVIAKTEQALTHLAKQFFEHSIERSYMAMIWGNIEPDMGTINQRLARDPKDRRRSKVTQDPQEGKHAVSHYQVLERFHFMNLVQCKLETGRTHQIRAHFTYLGHPLFNDELYGGNTLLKGPNFSKFKQFIQNCFELMPRQALHAQSLGFVHPKTHKNMHFECPLPPDFDSLLTKVRNYYSFLKTTP